jgi:hypothetical protein
MIPLLLSGLPVIHHEPGYLLHNGIFALASISMGITWIVAGFRKKIPLIGIPFAVLAIIFRATSLNRIKRESEKFKGSGFATASIVIGCAMLVTNIVIIASSVIQQTRHRHPRLTPPQPAAVFNGGMENAGVAVLL